jgi:hypothetical protein
MATNPRPSPPTPFRQPRCAWALYLLTLCALLAACGGGTNSAGGGIGGTGAVAVGTINGFGSVIVNGQEFDDTNAKIRRRASWQTRRAADRTGGRGAGQR